MKTRAAVLFKINSPLKIIELEIPPLKTGQVLVRLLYSGICRSQLNEILGFKGPDKYLPHVLGHEGVGIVEKVGPKVKKVKKNDYVVLSWIKGSGKDADPIQYHVGKKIINSGPIATFIQQAIITENRLVKIDKKMPADRAALLGCAIATGSGIVLHDLNPFPNSSLIIFGVGGVGLSALLGGVLKKCHPIIAVDINSQSLALAKQLGATYVFNFSSHIIPEIEKVCPGGVDFAIEASGKKEAMELAFAAIKNTGTLVIAGNLPQEEKISLNPFDFIKGKKITGTWGGSANIDRDIPFYVKAYLSGKLKLDHLFSKKYKLQDINQAFESMRSYRNSGRMLIDFTQ